MSEKKRFEFYSDDYLVGIIDTATGKKLNHFATIDLLNEQQDTIKQLEGKIKRLNAFIVSKDLAIEYLKWNKEKVMIDE